MAKREHSSPHVYCSPFMCQAQFQIIEDSEVTKDKILTCVEPQCQGGRKIIIKQTESCIIYPAVINTMNKNKTCLVYRD